jgi:hypothetical protein
MLIVNDYAFHQGTGRVGRVIGYGHQVVNGSERRTLKVACERIDSTGYDARDRGRFCF